MENNKVCCICGKKITGYGNNPDGAMWRDKNGNIVEYECKEGDVCCDNCNMRYVLVGRMYKIYGDKQ